MRINNDDLDSNIPSTEERPEGQIDVADRAIPGQSLTEYPGKNAYENPAQIDTAEEALNFAISKIQEPTQFKKTAMLMEQGVSLESMTKTLSFVMFHDGMITVDVMMVMQPYLFMFFMGIAREINVTPILFDSHDAEDMPIFENLRDKMSPELAEKKIKDTTRLEEEVEPDKMPEEVQAFMKMKGEELE